ncbi:hypothetical protein ACFRNJ_43175 [Streptomyces sp. NPDC056721]
MVEPVGDVVRELLADEQGRLQQRVPEGLVRQRGSQAAVAELVVV